MRLRIISGISFLLLLASVTFAQEPPRPWDLSFRLFTDYDSNVAQEPNTNNRTGSKGGWDIGVGAEGAYRFIQERQWELGAGGNFVQVWNTGSGLSDFNLTSLAPKLFGGYFFEAFTKPAQAEMAYQFRNDWLGGDNFEHSNMLQWDLGILPLPNLSTGVFYHLAFENFNDDGNAPRLTSRDAINHSLGIKGTYSFGYGRPSIMMNYAFNHNDADGRNFKFNSHGISAKFITPLILPVRLVLEAGYVSEDYTRFTPRPKRTQDNQNYGATLLIPLTRNISADLGYKFAKFKGSQSQFETDRHKVGLGITYAIR